MSSNIKHLTFNRFFIVLLLSVICCLLNASPAFADVDISTTYPTAGTFGSIGSLISALLPNIFMIAGVIFVILLIFGGFSVIMNAGKGDSKGTSKGKEMITWAMVGFILIFAAYWIIEIISYITGINIFTSSL